MTQSSERRVAVFDVEGTLIDCVSLILESWRQTLSSAGYSFTLEQLQPYSGMDGAWMLEQLLPEEQETEENRQSLLEHQAMRYRADFIHEAQPFPGIVELFESLRKDAVALGIATTCKADELAIYDRLMQLVPLVDAVSCGETVKHGKPNPGLLSNCLRALNVADPRRAVAIGDTPFDALAAKAIGMHSVGVLTGGFSELCLLDAGHERVFDQVRQVHCLWHANGGGQN